MVSLSWKYMDFMFLLTWSVLSSPADLCCRKWWMIFGCNKNLSLLIKWKNAHPIITLSSSVSASETTLSVFTVTSKSMMVQWSSHSGASSYKITATPKNSPERPVFAQFGSNTVMGSIKSLSPNTVYTVQLEAMDNVFNVLSSAKTEKTTGKDKTGKERLVKQVNSYNYSLLLESGIDTPASCVVKILIQCKHIIFSHLIS